MIPLPPKITGNETFAHFLRKYILYGVYLEYSLNGSTEMARKSRSQSFSGLRYHVPLNSIEKFKIATLHLNGDWNH